MADDLLKGHLNENVKSRSCRIAYRKSHLYGNLYAIKRMGLHDRGEIAPGKKLTFVIK